MNKITWGVIPMPNVCFALSLFLVAPDMLIEGGSVSRDEASDGPWILWVSWFVGHNCACPLLQSLRKRKNAANL